MSNPNINIGVVNESSVSAQTQVGKILFTEQGNQYIVKTDGSKMKISDIIAVSSLPSTNIQTNKIYILSTQNYSMNYYDGSAWHVLSGSNQIIIGTTAPTDTSKLFLDITDKTKPILKWYDSTTTSWTNIGGNTQIQSDWTQTDNTKLDYIKNKPTNTLIPSNIKQGTNVSLTTSGNDVTINVTGSNATSINNITVDDSARTNGTGLFYNSSTGKYENAMVNITGVVGSSQITTISDTTIASGSETTFNHPPSTNIVVGIEEQIIGSSVTDTHVDFSDSSKYTLQDSGKILVGNNKAQLDIYTKLLIHMDDSSFTDVCGHTITNTGVTLDTNNKVFGTGSASFNGVNSYLYLDDSEDFNFGNKDFTIELRIKLGKIGRQDFTCQMDSNQDTNTLSFEIGMLSDNTIFFAICNSSGTSYSIVSTNKLTDTTNFHSVVCSRLGNFIYLFVDGILWGSKDVTGIIVVNSSNKIAIGKAGESNQFYFKGNIDEFVITKGLCKYSSNFTVPTQSYGTPYSVINVPTYLKTTGTSDYSLTTIDTITSLTIPITLPSANTTCKCLVSFDNGVNYLYHDGTGWHKYTGDLTIAWISSNQVPEVSTYFTNLSITTLITNLSSLGIVPISFDMAFQLSTSDTSQTPTVSAITMVYVNKPHNEFASIGKYSDSYAEFGVKRINSSSIGVKNLTNSSKTVKVNIVTSV